MKVSLEEVEKWHEFVDNINSYKISEIEWMRFGNVLNIKKETIKEFEETGLNNINFPEIYELIKRK